jgi:hypothetical protein
MVALPRHDPAGLTSSDIPSKPCIYAWFRDGEPVYSGVAAGARGLRGRVWKYHLKTGLDLSHSSFRRNVCEHLGIAPTSRTRIRPTVMTAAEVDPVNAWIRSCEVTWLVCDSAEEAKQFKRDLHTEWLAPLSRR